MDEYVKFIKRIGVVGIANILISISGLIFIPIILILFVLLRGVKKEWTTEKQKIDNLGSLIYVVTMALLAYGITILDEWGIVLVVASLILLILFVIIIRSHLPSARIIS